MKRTAISMVLAAAAMLGLQAAPAQAQATRTWVSGVGDDVNPCSRTAPCKTFAGAISKTATGGEINCLDQGAFGALTITKSLLISCEGVTAGVLATVGSNGITINDAQTATPGTVVVTLRGLDINGANTGANGVRFLSGAALHIQNSQIRNFRAGAPHGNGILFAPTSTAELFVSDTVISENGSASAGAGISIKPTSGNAKVSLTRVLLENNRAGMSAEGGNGNVSMVVTNTTSGGNSGPGFQAVAEAGGGSVKIVVDESSSSNNSQGLQVVGVNAIVYLGNSVLTGNGTGLETFNGAQIQSFGNNRVEANGTNGAPSSVIPQK